MLAIAMLAGIVLLACTWIYQRSRPAVEHGTLRMKSRVKSHFTMTRPNIDDGHARREAEAADAMRKGKFTDPVDV